MKLVLFSNRNLPFSNSSSYSKIQVPLGLNLWCDSSYRSKNLVQFVLSLEVFLIFISHILLFISTSGNLLLRVRCWKLSKFYFATRKIEFTLVSHMLFPLLSQFITEDYCILVLKLPQFRHPAYDLLRRDWNLIKPGADNSSGDKHHPATKNLGATSSMSPA